MVFVAGPPALACLRLTTILLFQLKAADVAWTSSSICLLERSFVISSTLCFVGIANIRRSRCGWYNHYDVGCTRHSYTWKASADAMKRIELPTNITKTNRIPASDTKFSVKQVFCSFIKFSSLDSVFCSWFSAPQCPSRCRAQEFRCAQTFNGSKFCCFIFASVVFNFGTNLIRSNRTNAFILSLVVIIINNNNKFKANVSMSPSPSQLSPRQPSRLVSARIWIIVITVGERSLRINGHKYDLQLKAIKHMN